MLSSALICEKIFRSDKKMAEREGFEPSNELFTHYSLSRRAPSASSAISPLAYNCYFVPIRKWVPPWQDLSFPVHSTLRLD